MIISVKKYQYQSIILSLLWLSGAIKPFLLNYVGNIDLTLIMVVLATMDMIWNYKDLSTNANFRQGLFLVLIFYALMIISLSYSPSRNYKYVKVISFVANLVYFIYPAFVKRIDLKYIFYVYLFVFVPISMFYISMMSVLYISSGSSVTAFMDLRDNYLAIGFNLGVLFLLLYHTRKYLTLQFFVFILLVTSAARGALLFTVLLALLHVLIRNKRTTKFNLSRYIIPVLSAAAAFVVFSDKIFNYFSTSLRRFTSLAQGSDISSESRIKMMEFAASRPFLNNVELVKLFFGYGIGSFGITFFSQDTRAYPHNIFLEALYELGILGLFVFILFSIKVLLSLKLRSNVFSLIFLFAFLNAMKSNTISDLWIFFSFAAIVLLEKKGVWQQQST